jgi:hypothetical protein
MVALPPITAGSTLPGYTRQAATAPTPAPAQPAPGSATPSSAIGGGAATSAIANQARKELFEGTRALASGGSPAEASGRPRASLPEPPYSQNIGLYDNSTRVFVDIVLSGDSGQRVARVFGTPPAPKPQRQPVNIVA